MSTDITLLSSEGIHFVILFSSAPIERHVTHLQPAERKNHHFYMLTIGIGRQGNDKWQ